jgi:hypothetical protein
MDFKKAMLALLALISIIYDWKTQIWVEIDR